MLFVPALKWTEMKIGLLESGGDYGAITDGALTIPGWLGSYYTITALGDSQASGFRIYVGKKYWYKSMFCGDTD